MNIIHIKTGINYIHFPGTDQYHKANIAMFAHSGVQHILCCVFFLFFFVFVYPMLPGSLDCSFLLPFGVLLQENRHHMKQIKLLLV
jgi:hypothetical protein